MKNKNLIVCSLLMLLPVYVLGQQISGRVTDSSGQSLAGVVVVLDGTQLTTITSGEGIYRISAPKDGVLRFSFLGFETQQVRVGNRTVIDVTMEDADMTMEQVVVVGYGTTVKKDLTGSISQVDVSELENASLMVLDEAIGGRIAGVQAISSDGQPGSFSDIVIRGGNSITQSNSPLYVIDGFAIESPDPSTLDPANILSVDILKDASATAIYGARGANGVIMITTKRGTVSKPRVSYKGYVAFQDAYKHMDVLNPYEYVTLMYELDPEYGGRYFTDGKTPETYLNVQGVDWQDKILRTGLMHSHNVALNGGTEDTRYSASVSFFDQDGVIVGSGFRRWSGRITLDQKINRSIDLGLNLSYNNSETKGVVTSQSSTTDATSYLLYSAWAYQPVSTKMEIDLEQEAISEDVESTNDYRFNPYMQATNEHVLKMNESLMVNANVNVKIIDGLNFKAMGGINRIHQKNEVFYNKNTRQGLTGSLGVYGAVNQYITSHLSNENTLTYKKKAGYFTIEAMLGNSLLSGRRTRAGGQSVMVEEDGLGINSLPTGSPRNVYTEDEEWSMASFFGRAFLNYRDRYLLTATYRADGSSKLAKGNKWDYFPSASFAWRMSEESFLKDVRSISQIKLRVSWGVTGNNRVSNYASYGVLSNAYYLSSLVTESSSGNIYSETLNYGVAQTTMANENLRWEKTYQWDTGVDLAFFKSRLTLTVDLYRKRTKDLLLQADLPASSTYTSAMKNIGEVENKGLEITLGGVPVKKKNFTWDVDFNISFNRNKVLALNDDQQQMPRYISWDTQYKDLPAYVVRVGEPIGQMYGYVWDGVYQIADFTWQDDSDPTIPHGMRNYTIKPGVADYDTGSRPGDIKYKNLVGDDDKVDVNDMTVIGNALPKFIGGISNRFKYRNFDLSVFFNFSYGNDILNANRLYMERLQSNFTNQFTSVLDRWKPERESNTMYGVKGMRVSNYSSRVIEDGSFLRLKTLTLGYTIPRKVVKKIGIRQFRIYATAQNLWTLTNYTGFDPEVSTRGSAVTSGFDFSAYPRGRNYLLGVNLTF